MLPRRSGNARLRAMWVQSSGGLALGGVCEAFRNPGEQGALGRRSPPKYCQS